MILVTTLFDPERGEFGLIIRGEPRIFLGLQSDTFLDSKFIHLNAVTVSLICINRISTPCNRLLSHQKPHHDRGHCRHCCYNRKMHDKFIRSRRSATFKNPCAINRGECKPGDIGNTKRCCSIFATLLRRNKSIDRNACYSIPRKIENNAHYEYYCQGFPFGGNIHRTNGKNGKCQ